ncbi:hypothetical protein HDU97_010216 [Phlyctochytrium planicorne]|nr:hypothetical protein HDU97_010216 [Phlyctochytrium planicorne]
MSPTALFTPIRLGGAKGGIELQHRVAMAPLTRARGNNNQTTDIMVPYYAQRASKGGLLITEGVHISPESRTSIKVPGIYEPEMIEGWKKITEVNLNDLRHVGRSSHSSYDPKGRPPGSSSATKKDGNVNGLEGPTPAEVPRELTEEEIQQVINDYAQAAKNAVAAGCDGIEIHSANGYLLDQFINDNINFRTDKYGGSAENRVRFSYEVAKACADAIGSNRVGIRLSPYSVFQGMGDSDRVNTYSTLLKQLNELDLAFVHLVESRVDGASDSTEDKGARTLRPFREAYQGVLISAGGFLPESAEAYVADKEADIIAFGRYFISNPDLPYRILKRIPLTPYDRSTFYTNDEKGYTDYPAAEVQHNEE